MRKLSILALCVVLALANCQKSSIAPSSNTSNSASAADATTKSNFDLITAHSWMYNKYYTNYVDSSNKGKLVYKRGRATNKLVLDNSRLTLYVDGTSLEVDENGNSVHGTWHFTDLTQTKLVIHNYTGAIYEDIVFLNRNNLRWVREGYNVYAEYITAN